MIAAVSTLGRRGSGGRALARVKVVTRVVQPCGDRAVIGGADRLAGGPRRGVVDLVGSSMIDRPLKRASRPVKQRPDLSQIVIDHRLPDCAPQRQQQLPNPHPRQLRIVRQQPMNLRLERLQHALPWRSLIARRRLAAQRPPNRVLRQPRLAHQPLDRLPSNEMLAPQPGPLLHTNHPLAAFLIADTTRLGIHPDDSADRPGGQFSNGGGGSVFTRRRQPGSQRFSRGQ